MPWQNAVQRAVATLVALGFLCGVIGGNVTVDDTDTAIYYTPNHWNANAGGACVGCAATPDVSQIHDGTWHDSTNHPGDPTIILQYTFTGTDLYIYGILWDNPVYLSNVDLVLTVDGTNYTYQRARTGTGDSYEYNIPVFSVHNLQNQAHTARVALNVDSNFLFDYLIYTTSDTTSTSSTFPTYPSTTATPKNSSLSPGAIAGIAIGAIAFIAIIASIVGFICYRQGKREQPAPVVLPTSSAAPSQPLVQSVPWSVPVSSDPPSTGNVGTSVATWSDINPPPRSTLSVSPAITTPPAYWDVYNEGGARSDITGGPDSGTSVSYRDNPTTTTSLSTGGKR